MTAGPQINGGRFGRHGNTVCISLSLSLQTNSIHSFTFTWVIPLGSLTLNGGMGPRGPGYLALVGAQRVWRKVPGFEPSDDVDVAVFFDALLAKFLLPLSFSCVASQ